MFEDTNLGPEILKNPALLQSMVLTEYQNRLGGVYSVADPNNSFNLQLEAASSMSAQLVRWMESSFNAQYAVRATTAAELYNSMSDFDYLNMVASPSNSTANLTFNVDYLIANAVSYDSTYNRVVIPPGTQFFFGPLTFGIYYPINININKFTNNITVLWDTTTINPLNTLTTNMVSSTQYSYGGLNLITLQIPVYQFATTSTIYPVVAQQGFIKPISYTDQFYAVRVYTNLPTGSWTELNYTLSETVYDPTVPTAKITIQNDTNTLIVSIPQIYFTNNQIGNQVKVSILTTKGAVNVDLTSVSTANINVSFDLNSPDITPYSAILSNLATIDLIPGDTTIVGGSNALTFANLKSLIVNGGLYTSAPVTPAQLDAFASKNGFSLTKYIDNVTDRIYFASNTITGGANGYALVTTGNINVTANITSPTILSFADKNAITILPTTIYAYDASSNICTPLNQTQLNYLNSLTGASLAAELNGTTYTKCPFHIVTYTDSQYPVTKSFNLMNPSVSSIRFVTDNILSSPQMSLVSAVVIHNNNGTGGYTIRLGVVKNTAMQAIAETNITVCLMTKDYDGNYVYGTATLTSTTPALYIYELNIPTTYYISNLDTIQATMTASDQASFEVDLNLTSTFDVIFAVAASAVPGLAQSSDVVVNIPPVYSALIGISRQQIDVVFGTDLSDSVYNITNASWSSTTYMTYPQTIYQTYPADVYQTNAQGGLVYSIANGVVTLTKLHSAGDQVLNALGKPIVLHNAGDLVLDANGSPVVAANGSRQLQYYISSIMFDLRMFYSQAQADVSFVNGLTSTLSSYFTTIANIQKNLLEQTNLFYTPNSTIGTATFSLGNNTPVTLNLGFSFSLVIYVSAATLQNQNLVRSLKSDINSIVQAEMKNSIISLTNVASTIESQLSESVLGVDIEGIDGTQTMQTVIVPNNTINPIVGQTLVWDTTANSMSLQPAVTIEMKLAQ